MNKIKIIKRTMNILPNIRSEILLKLKAPGTVVSILSERPAHRFLLIKMNIFIWMPIRKIKQLLRL